MLHFKRPNICRLNAIGIFYCRDDVVDASWNQWSPNRPSISKNKNRNALDRSIDVIGGGCVFYSKLKLGGKRPSIDLFGWRQLDEKRGLCPPLLRFDYFLSRSFWKTISVNVVRCDCNKKFLCQ